MSQWEEENTDSASAPTVNSAPSERQDFSPVPLQFKWGSSAAIVYYCGLLFMDFLMMAILSVEPSELIALVAMGMIAGQMAFVAACSLMGANWLEGILLSAAGLLGIIVMCSLPLAFRGSVVPGAVVFTPCLPAICFIACSPLVMMRWWFGWRLTSSSIVAPSRSRLSIEDLILVPSAVVAIFVAANVGSSFADDTFSSFSIWYVFSAIPATVICLIAVVPITYWFFRSDAGVAAWIASCGLLFAWTVAFIFGVALLSAGNFPPQFLLWTLGFMGVASLVGLAGFQILRSTDFRLTAYPAVVDSTQLGASPQVVSSAPATLSAPFDLDEPQISLSSSDLVAKNRRVRFRIAVGALVAMTTIVNAAVWTFTTNRLDRLLASIVADGGVVQYSSGAVVSIDFGASNLRTHLEALPKMKTVREVKLNRTAAADLWFWRLRKFPSLRTLDIRDVKFEPHMLAGFVPTDVKIVVWSDQFTSEQFDTLKQAGYTIEKMDR